MIAMTTRSMRRPHRFAVIAFVGAALAVTAYAQSQARKAPPPDVGPGRVAWFDITTSDIARAKTFYGGLFGWTFTPVQGAGDGVAEIVSREVPIGTIRVADGAIAPFNGVVYVQVDDIQASCKQAITLGGKVVAGFPFNLTERTGAVALVIDPSGHPIGMYSRTPLASKQVPELGG